VSFDTTHDSCWDINDWFRTPSIVVLGCPLVTIFLSNNDFSFNVSKDNLDFAALHNFNHVLSESEESFCDDDFEIPPPPKCTKRSYDLTHKFHMKSFVKCPWIEIVLEFDVVLHMVHCHVH